MKRNSKSRDVREEVNPESTEQEAVEETACEADASAEVRTEETPAEVADPLREELDAAVKARDEYLAMAQRVQAEFDNFRKRNASTRTDALEEGKTQSVKAMLPVLDNLERTLQAMQGLDESYRSGIEMVLRQLKDILKGLGLAEIPAEGQAFDPRLHEAVMTCPADDEHPANTVVLVLQKGYTVNQKVIRASMVQVAQ